MIEGIFDTIATAVREKYTNAYVIPKSISSLPSRFPAVSVVQENETNTSKYKTFDRVRNVYSQTVYFDIYAETFEECVIIAKIIDDLMSEEFRFNKSTNRPLSVNADDTVCRRVMRFNKKNNIYEEE